MHTQRRRDAAPADRGGAERDFAFARRHCFLIGVGGAGMSGLARMIRARGAVVSGSDMQRTPVTDALIRDGFEITFDGEAAEAALVPDGVDTVIVSAAIGPDHPGRLAAQRRGLPTLTYAEALGRCMEGRTGVAVAGTHGKSTTGAMLAWILMRAGLDPSAIIGANCASLSPPGAPPVGFRLGASQVPAGPLAGAPGYLIAEACEFNRSFHNLRPAIASIGAVEADHLDIYGSLDAVVEAFREFVSLLPGAEEGGKLLIGHEGAHRREVTAGARCAVETIGFAPGADWRITLDEPAGTVALARRNDQIARWPAPLPGEHNAFNSALAAALATTLGADRDAIEAALGTFQGLERRTERLGERPLRGGGAAVLYDDYGHHPTEVDATLRAIRRHERIDEEDRRLVCVFQPHQHSRTRFLLDEFAQSFSQADLVVVPHIYFVRDSEIEKSRVSAADLVDRLRGRGVQAMHVYPFDAIVEQLEIIARPGDVIVVMGAGPVWRVAHSFMGRSAALLSA